MAGILAGERATAARFGEEVSRLLAKGERTSDMTGTTTIAGVERIDDIAILSGYSYRIVATGLHVVSTVAGDRVRCEVRYTTDGTTPTTSSAQMRGTLVTTPIAVGGSGQNSSNIDVEYEPGSNQTLSLLLCVARDGGTGTVRLFADTNYASQLKLYRSGVAVGDVGVDV